MRVKVNIVIDNPEDLCELLLLLSKECDRKAFETNSPITWGTLRQDIDDVWRKATKVFRIGE